jgi:predicted HicB family RNase H-like nuclease
MMEYRGYVGVIEYDPDEEHFHGTIVNLAHDGITFAGRSVDELKAGLMESVEDYLAFCAERGEEPEKPFSGTFLVRTTPRIHGAVALAATKARKSVNAWVSETLERAAGDDDRTTMTPPTNRVATRPRKPRRDPGKE